MSMCSDKALSETSRECAWAAVGQLSDSAISALAAEAPDVFYKWCVDAYTAKRQAELEIEFQTALLEKLQRCDPQLRSNTLAAA